jgi:hypothetical protein
MRTNFFPIHNNALLVYNEAKNNLKESELLQLISTSKFELIPVIPKSLPEILFITSYPPRECGIATYTQDLRNAIMEKFGATFSLKVCALESTASNLKYPEEVKYKLNTQIASHYLDLLAKIDSDKNIAMIFLQHEFGLFGGVYGAYLLKFMKHLNRPLTTTFHTVLPNPDIYKDSPALTAN